MKRFTFLRLLSLLLLFVCLVVVGGITFVHTRSANAAGAKGPADLAVDQSDGAVCWSGQGAYSANSSQFDMKLTLVTDSNKQITGQLYEDTYNSSVAISGSYQPDNGEVIFTDPSSVSGNGIELNINYTGYFQDEIRYTSLTGTWTYPNSSDGGTFSLAKTACAS